jgi:hypothetical protein
MAIAIIIYLCLIFVFLGATLAKSQIAERSADA